MYKPITSSPLFQTEFKNSMTLLGKKMMDHHRELFPTLNRKEEKNNRSLAAHIIKLNNGEGLGWWRERPEAVERLVAMLGIAKDDLNLDQRDEPHVFRFPMFQDLPGLDTERERPYRIAHPELRGQDRVSYETLDYWFATDSRANLHRKPDWLYVQDELEFELLSKTIKTPLGERSKSMSVEELVEHASAYIRPYNPLIVIVHTPTEAESLYRLLDYVESAPLLLISRYPLPGPESTSSSKEPSRPDYYRQQINYWIWRLLPDWRERLVDWVVRRLGENTNFDADGFKAWLREFDPAHLWIAQSGDVMLLCQVANDEFYPTSEQLLRGDDDPDLFENFFGPHRLRRLKLLVDNRWKQLGLPWEGALSEGDWTAIGDGTLSFATMRRDRLVSPVGDDFGFAQPVLVRLLLKTLLTSKIKNGALLDWSAACFDQRRRPILEAILETIKDEDLILLANKVDQEDSPQLLIGAVEALFVVAGKRIVRDPALARALSSIARHVFATIDPDGQAPFPWSRPLTTPEHGYEWFAACWSWSLHLPRPANTNIRWSLPGWDHRIPEQVAQWLNPRQGFHIPASWSSAHPPWQDLLPVIEQWVSGCATPPEIADAAMFRPAMLANAAEGRWPVNFSWWYGTIGTAWAEHALLTALQTTGRGEVSESAALALWPSLIRYQVSKLNEGAGGRWSGGRLASSNPLSPLFSPVVAAITKALGRCPEKALKDLRDKELEFLQDHPEWLSVPLKLTLLQRRARARPLSLPAFRIFGFFDAYGPDAAAALQPFLDDGELGMEAARRLWEWAPDIARRLLDDPSFECKASARHLLVTTPPDAMPSAIGILRRNPELSRSPEVSSWMRITLPDAGAHAHELLALASR